MIREGSGEPLLLLHGITATERCWLRVIPHLTAHHDVIATTAPGHKGGPVWSDPPPRFSKVADAFERVLDDLGIDLAHIAGNSMGGWMALELARRGRARSVCAFSPSGSYEIDSDEHRARVRNLSRMVADARRSRRILPLIARLPQVRRFGSRLNAVHGERVPAAHFVELAGDSAACTVYEELLASEETMAPLDPPPCPITIAWAEKDRVLPLDPLMERTRALVPGAEYRVLEDVGHVPMLDDPELVARTILERTQRTA